MIVCVCACVYRCVRACVFQTVITSKYQAQGYKDDLFFNLTTGVQAQIQGLTVEQRNCRNLGPEIRNRDRSVTVNLIN